MKVTVFDHDGTDDEYEAPYLEITIEEGSLKVRGIDEELNRIMPYAVYAPGKWTMYRLDEMPNNDIEERLATKFYEEAAVAAEAVFFGRGHGVN